MSDPTLITGAFAEFLEVNRGTLNHEVATTARQASGFDPAAFAEVLRSSVTPIVDTVDRLGTGFVVAVSETLFRVALDLCAQRRFDGAVRDGWDRLLPALAAPLTEDPRRVVASITNALDSLDRTPGARPRQWVDLVLGAAAHAPNADALLQAGQVAAWRSGMAAYRGGVLDLAPTLDPALVAVALGLEPPGSPGSPGSMDDLLARLQADPWFDPSGPDGGPTGDRPPIAVGSFRGFGGAFLRPPTIVAGSDRRVLVTDGVASWFVFADAFGSALVRAGAAAVSVPDGVGPTPGAPPPELAGVAEVSTWIRTAAGVVATSGLSHSVLFVRAAA